ASSSGLALSRGTMSILSTRGSWFATTSCAFAESRPTSFGSNVPTSQPNSGCITRSPGAVENTDPRESATDCAPTDRFRRPVFGVYANGHDTPCPRNDADVGTLGNAPGVPTLIFAPWRDRKGRWH